MSQRIIDGSLVFLLSKGTQALHRQLNRTFHAKEYDITFEQCSILIYLFNCDGKSQNEIAKKTIRDKVSVTKIIDNLEKNNFVKRAIDDKDRRVRRIFLTDEGKNVVPKLKKIADQTLEEAFKDVNKNDVESFKKVLSLIVQNLTGEDLLKFIKNNKGRWK
jgi:DNA-binding MarR family transcriptional regulator